MGQEDVAKRVLIEIWDQGLCRIATCSGNCAEAAATVVGVEPEPETQLLNAWSFPPQKLSCFHTCLW